MADVPEQRTPDDWPGPLDDRRPLPGGSVRTVPRTQQLCEALADGLHLDGAAVAMIIRTGERDLVLATDPVIGQLDELEFSLAEGPCLDAYRARAAVLAADLTDESSRRRWPTFAREASAAGAGAAFAFPLITGGVCFGVIELYRRIPGPLTAAALDTVDAALGAVTGVAQDELLGPHATNARPHSWPARLTSAHAGVHQAAGMVAVHLEADVDDAMARLRAMAYTENTSLAELAHRVLEGTTRLDKD